MENISAKGGMSVLLPVVLLSLSSIVGAVDIIFYPSTSACSGSGYSFNSIAASTCCIANGGSVLFTGMDGCKSSQVYRNGGCDSGQVGSGTGNVCYVGGGYTSGFWFQSCIRRSLLGEAESDLTKCQSKAEPTAVVFTEDATKGSWILKSSDAQGLFSQLENLPEGEKVNLLQMQGASFSASTIVPTNIAN